jgi:hypothetical protein
MKRELEQVEGVNLDYGHKVMRMTGAFPYNNDLLHTIFSYIPDEYFELRKVYSRFSRLTIVGMLNVV